MVSYSALLAQVANLKSELAERDRVIAGLTESIDRMGAELAAGRQGPLP